METTLVILKPDCVARRLAGKVIQRLEEKGLQIVGMKLMNISPALARRMYAVHKGKEFYKPLIRFMTRGPVIPIAVKGKDAAVVVRKMLGPTFGPDAPAGTVRGDFGMSKRYNLVHGSDSAKNAKKEIALFFKPAELVKGNPPDFDLIYDTTGRTLV